MVQTEWIQNQPPPDFAANRVLSVGVDHARLSIALLVDPFEYIEKLYGVSAKTDQQMDSTSNTHLLKIPSSVVCSATRRQMPSAVDFSIVE